MFPAIESFATGYLPVSDGNEIYWETTGNPEGKPALHLHGGPGGGMGPGYRRRFDPEKFFIVGFEQRGCGRSRPRVIDPDAPDLMTNNTQALIADIEALREHFGVEKWLLTGLSWGSTLALSYAQAHPDRVSEIVLFAVTTTSPAEVDWITESVGRIFPREWERFEGASCRKPGQRVIDAYYELITDPDPAVRQQAARDWCIWEDVHISLDPKFVPHDDFADSDYAQIFATLVIHYWKHAGFNGDPGLIAHMDKTTHIPGVLIHGKFDVSGPLLTAWKLHKVWPNSELIVVDEGHGGDEMINHMLRAIDRFAPVS